MTNNRYSVMTSNRYSRRSLGPRPRPELMLSMLAERRARLCRHLKHAALSGEADHDGHFSHDDGVSRTEGEAGDLDDDIAQAARHHVVDENGGAAHHHHADAVGAGDADGGAGVLVDEGAPCGQASDENVRAAGAGREWSAMGRRVGDARCWGHFLSVLETS